MTAKEADSPMGRVSQGYDSQIREIPADAPTGVDRTPPESDLCGVGSDQCDMKLLVGRVIESCEPIGPKVLGRGEDGVLGSGPRAAGAIV